ncbi:MAG: hypothetical protein J6X18_02590 [Bacteroidales bacterium]|nr:hypothetical protein [Bacteroidales bacterium]
MSSHVSYIIETNGENGVRLDYQQIGYAPSSVQQWESGVNSFGVGEELPPADSQDSPLFVRQGSGGTWTYYRKSIVMPSKTSKFLISVLVDGSEDNGGFVYETFTSFFNTTMDGGFISVTSRTNTGANEREGTISITDNTYGETILIYVVQEHTSIGIGLAYYRSNGLSGENEGEILTHSSFTHTFYWLTDKHSINNESLEIDVAVTGPRNGFIIRDISKYAYDGELDDTCVFSVETGKYYRMMQKCLNGGLETVYEEIIFNPDTEAVYTKVRYENDLKITKVGDKIVVTNYGRCFIQDDAYYVLTLSNVDDLDNKAYIIIRYDSDDLATHGRGGVELVNPYMWMQDGYVMLSTDNDSQADQHFIYYVSFVNGQLVYSTDSPDTISSRIENNELITLIE